MHDGGGGFGGGHMGGHVGGGHMGGGHTGGHPGAPAAHHHGSHGSPDMGQVVPGYIPGDTRRRHDSLAAAGQRFTPTIAFLVFAVILAIVLLVV